MARKRRGVAGVLSPRRTARGPGGRPRRRAAMALSKLDGDAQAIIFVQLCNVLDPGVAVALSSVSNELRTATKGLLPQLRADHEDAAALGRKAGMRSCKEMREAKEIKWSGKALSAADLETLGTLGSVLPALERLEVLESPTHALRTHFGMPVGLGADALHSVVYFACNFVFVGNAGASALAAALDRGALPQLKELYLGNAVIGDPGLVALAPVLRRRPALERLILWRNRFGDKGIAALVAPPPPLPEVAPSPPTRGLAKLKELDLEDTYVTDAGCAVLAAALDSGALPDLRCLELGNIPASAAAKAAVYEARGNLAHNESGSGSDSDSY